MAVLHTWGNACAKTGRRAKRTARECEYFMTGIGEGKVGAKLASGKAKDQRLGMGTGHCLEERAC